MIQYCGEALIDMVLSSEVGSGGDAVATGQFRPEEVSEKTGYQLIADIGGTNTRFGLGQDGQLLVATCQSFKNVEFKSFEAVLACYLDRIGNPSCSGCCIAVAATVVGNVAQLTNLDWQVDAMRIGSILDVKNISLINDLESLGYALDALSEKDITPFFAADQNIKMHHSKLVVGIGTGFNAATMRRFDNGNATVFPSETGHMAFPLGNGIDAEICQFASSSDGFCSIEDILSGNGLEVLYRWFSQGGSMGAAEICASLGGGNDPIALKSAQLFVPALGGVIGDIALSQLPYGGIYLAGSVARSLTPYFEQYGFLEAFQNKGRKSGVMTKFDLSLLRDDFAALNGCLVYLSQKK